MEPILYSLFFLLFKTRRFGLLCSAMALHSFLKRPSSFNKSPLQVPSISSSIRMLECLPVVSTGMKVKMSATNAWKDCHAVKPKDFVSQCKYIWVQYIEPIVASSATTATLLLPRR